MRTIVPFKHTAIALRAAPWIKPIIRRRRERQFRATLADGRVFPVNELDAIVADYRSICLDTMLCTFGILNLEVVVRWVAERGIPGAFVECGTWRGGALAYLARAANRLGLNNRAIYGFDSFEGLPEPVEYDGIEVIRRSAELRRAPPSTSGALRGGPWSCASYDSCAALLAETGYPQHLVNIRKGWFQTTLPSAKTEIGPISILRLDGDFYESTKVCLETLYDSIVAGGCLIIDDYGDLPGCKRATDEFWATRKIALPLHYVQRSIRYVIKPFR
jgi:hypothetical protein